MKLNKQKWLNEVRRVEGEIKAIKKTMHEPGYERTFPFQKLHKLKAEATRLYFLRRLAKGMDMRLESFWHLRQSQDKKHLYCHWKKAEKFTSESIASLILDGELGWKEQFSLTELPVDPSLQPTG